MLAFRVTELGRWEVLDGCLPTILKAEDPSSLRMLLYFVLKKILLMMIALRFQQHRFEFYELCMIKILFYLIYTRS
jgi:hypothetical protein